MPMDVAASLRATEALRSDGPHAPSTVRRRLASWGALHCWKGLNGPFAGPSLRSAMRLAVRACGRPGQRKSEWAVTADVMEQLLAVCDGDSLIDIRDRARLLLAFGSGGRRRSEMTKLRVEDLRDESAVQSTDGPLSCMSLRLRQTKTTPADDDARAWVAVRSVVALKEWLTRGEISSGAVCRAIDRWGTVEGSRHDAAERQSDCQTLLFVRRT